MLLKFEFIKKEEFENHDVYFVSTYDLKDKKLRYITTKEKSKKIIEYLKKYDFGITKTQLSIDLKMHINIISKYLKMLEDLKIIIKKRPVKKILYFLNDDYIERSSFNYNK